ncbi:MAG TPA: hypothetical protein VNZ58_02235 [Thermomicrobiales bacterium]|nr:hypothetical protein [Thermomicrobiales bacterium]
MAILPKNMITQPYANAHVAYQADSIATNASTNDASKTETSWHSQYGIEVEQDDETPFGVTAVGEGIVLVTDVASDMKTRAEIEDKVSS